MKTKAEYLRVLGLSDGASIEDIKKAYRELVKKYHPDSAGTNENSHKFIEITEAYNNLVKGNYRILPRQEEHAFRRIVKRIYVTLEELVHGCTRKLFVPDVGVVDMTIPSGSLPGECVSTILDNILFVGILVPCEHFRFVLQGNRDLMMRHPIEVNVLELSIGTVVNIETLHGTIEVRIPAGFNGSALRIPGYGLRPKFGRAGDLYCPIRSYVPKIVDGDSVKKIKDVLACSVSER